MTVEPAHYDPPVEDQRAEGLTGTAPVVHRSPDMAAEARERLHPSEAPAGVSASLSSGDSSDSSGSQSDEDLDAALEAAGIETVGGGWYEVPEVGKVQGKEAALEEYRKATGSGS